jgi:ribosome-associated protein
MPRPDEPHDSPATPASTSAEPPSKTRVKQAMTQLQDLGEALVAIDSRRLAELGLPERLEDALRAAKQITKHEARRRQLQFVGRLMRDVDPEPIRATLARWAEIPNAEKARFAALERWRDRLLEDDAALDAYLDGHPQTPRKELAARVAAARGERSRGGPPRHVRELFRYLRAHDDPK